MEHWASKAVSQALLLCLRTSLLSGRYILPHLPLAHNSHLAAHTLQLYSRATQEHVVTTVAQMSFCRPAAMPLAVT